MKVFFKDVVMTDIEKFLAEAPASDEMPITQYANAKGFDVTLFREFMNKLSNWSYATSNQIDANNVSVNEIKSTLTPEELVWKKPWPQTRGNKNLVYFSLTDEDLVRYQDMIVYYTALSWFTVDEDPSWAIHNSHEVFNIYWKYTPKNIPEDQYSEPRYLQFPYLLEMSQRSNHSWEIKHVDVPERYKTEYYYSGMWVDPQKEIDEWEFPEKIWDHNKYVMWRLIPTTKETPYDNGISSMTYTYEPIHNMLPTQELQWGSAIKWNIIWDWYFNMTRDPRQGK